MLTDRGQQGAAKSFQTIYRCSRSGAYPALARCSGRAKADNSGVVEGAEQVLEEEEYGYLSLQRPWHGYFGQSTSQTVQIRFVLARYFSLSLTLSENATPFPEKRRCRISKQKSKMYFRISSIFADNLKNPTNLNIQLLDGFCSSHRNLHKFYVNISRNSEQF